MPFYGKLISQTQLWKGVCWILLFGISVAFAEEADRPLHYSADRQIWNRRENRVELKGHALVRQLGESLSADEMTLDLRARTVHARGNCVYLSPETVIQGEEMRFNLDTRTGSIVKGRVSNEQFSLAGERINKLSNRRFQTHWGEYSTCRDCPQSWALQAEDVDMQIEGYAFLSNVTAKVKDAPSLWIPYLIVPLKTERQSGLLFPRIKFTGQHGFVFVLPYFWATGRSTDMTLGLGRYSARGWRGEWEGRYVLSDQSFGTANYYYLQDGTPEYKNVIPNRWALSVAQSQELPWGIIEKMQLYEISDNLYPLSVGDVPGSGELFLGSTVSLSHASPWVSSYVSARRFRNLLNTNPNLNDRITEFDSKTVQAIPAAVVTTNDQLLFGNTFAFGLTMGATNFTRSAGGFDYDDSSYPFGTNPGPNPKPYTPGVDPIRKATRFSLTPSLYSTLRPFDVLSVTPALKYNAYYYSFRDVPDVKPLYRSYLLYQTDVSTQWERVYETENPEIPRVKHLIRPAITYSYIPVVHPDVKDTQHEFLQQIQRHPGYNFDNYDIVPLDSSAGNIRYFTPLGNSIAYGITTQVIRRKGRMDSEEPSYQRSIEWTANHSYNFRDTNQPMSRFASALRSEFDAFSSVVEYAYTPYVQNRHWISGSGTMIFERAMHQRVLSYDRSVTAGYTFDQESRTSNLIWGVTYSLNDYVMPSLNASYSFESRRYLNYGVKIQFQSPSRCWRIALGFSSDINTGMVMDPQHEFNINLTGSGFSGMQEITSPGSK